jgi:hypothetical protein
LLTLESCIRCEVLVGVEFKELVNWQSCTYQESDVSSDMEVFSSSVVMDMVYFTRF